MRQPAHAGEDDEAASQALLQLTLVLTELFSSLSGCLCRGLVDLVEWYYAHVGTFLGVLSVVVIVFSVTFTVLVALGAFEALKVDSISIG